ncbi:MAG: hypothetical protein ACPGGG_06175, partial [Parvibaculales bacterium]
KKKNAIAKKTRNLFELIESQGAVLQFFQGYFYLPGKIFQLQPHLFTAPDNARRVDTLNYTSLSHHNLLSWFAIDCHLTAPASGDFWATCVLQKTVFLGAIHNILRFLSFFDTREQKCRLAEGFFPVNSGAHVQNLPPFSSCPLFHLVSALK